MIDRGADIMYAERFGVSDAAKERGVKVIGNVIDTSAQYPGTVLASALWHMEPTIDRAVKAVLEGRFEAADYGPYSFMAHGGGEPRRRRQARRPGRGEARARTRRRRSSTASSASTSTTPSRSRADPMEPGRTRAAGLAAAASGARSSSRSPASTSASARSSPTTPSTSTCGAARSWRCSARTAPARRR